ncbi:MAG: hypothetical protein ACYSW8_19885, partial [Planctomycetota bacterium]
WELYLPEGEHTIMYRTRDMRQQQEFKKLSVKKGEPVEGLVIKVTIKTSGGSAGGPAATSSRRTRN